MKYRTLLIATLLAFSALLTAEELGKVYIPMKNLSFTENGIFFKTECALVELDNISYDYQAQSYCFAEEKSKRMTRVNCPYCGEFSWWVQGNCCFNDDCRRSCF